MTILFLAAAAGSAKPVHAEEPKKITIHGDVRITRTITEDGIPEYQIARREHRLLVPDTWNTLLYARDLTGDGRPDAWFYRDAYGILEHEDRTAAESDGWDVAQDLLAREANTEDRLYIALAFNEISDLVSFTASYVHDVGETLQRRELDIGTLQILLFRMMDQQPDHPAIPVLEGMINHAITEMIDEIQDHYIEKCIAAATADVLLVRFGGEAIRGIEKIGSKTLRILLRSQAAVAIKQVIERFGIALKEAAIRWTAKVEGRIGLRGSKLAAEKALAEAEAHWLARMTASEQVRFSIQALMSRSRLAAAAGKAFGAIGGVASKSLENWRYIAVTQSMQVGAEVLARGKELWDPNPIVMAKKLATDKDFIQDFAFMSNETFWTAGLSNSFNGLGAKMIACGLFSLMDSAVMNFAIRHTTDPARTTLDTSWEVVVGNSQTQLDMASLRLFESVANKTGNPKLRLVGYLAAIVDQSVGYFLYGKTTEALEDKERGVKVKLIPVLAEAP